MLNQKKYCDISHQWTCIQILIQTTSGLSRTGNLQFNLSLAIQMFKGKLAILLSEKKSKNSNVTDSRKGGRAKQFQAAVGYLQPASHM
jgi:hypothetical protein